MAQEHNNKIPVYETLPIVKSHMLPEGAHYYRDDGCIESDHCLSCPLAICVLDTKSVKIKRDSDILGLRSAGFSTAEICDYLVLDPATVHKVYKSSILAVISQ